MGPALVFLCFCVLYIAIALSGERRGAKITWIILLAYLLRVALQRLTRDVQFFTHAAGGDYTQYEFLADMITKLWRNRGIHFIQADELTWLGATSLPPNLFAFIIYLNDGPTRSGCTAIVAMCACLAMLNFYKLAIHLGASEKSALIVTTVLLYSPSFLLYSSDMYKEGLVLFLLLGAFGSAIRLGSRFSMVHLLFGAACVFGLWFVRFYLVFTAIAALVVGATGLGSKKVWRQLFAVSLVIIVSPIVLSNTTMMNEVAQSAEARFTEAADEAAYMRDEMAQGGKKGSFVSFDDGGSPYGALPTKVSYTLFAPFPWQRGSMGFQIGKVDTLLWYYLFYRMLVAIRKRWKENFGLILVFLVFILPMIIVYATTIYNIGLVVRQRLSIVIVASLLATLSWPKQVEIEEREAEKEALKAALARARSAEKPTSFPPPDPTPEAAE